MLKLDVLLRDYYWFMILFKTGVYITTTNKIQTEVTGETFPVEFEIIDPLYKPGKSKYFVAVSYFFFNGGVW